MSPPLFVRTLTLYPRFGRGRAPEVERLLRDHAAFRHLPTWLLQPGGSAGDAAAPAGDTGSGASRFTAVYMPQEQQANASLAGGAAAGAVDQDATPRSLACPSLASARSTFHAALPSPSMASAEEGSRDPAEPNATSGASEQGRDVDAPVIARERQRARRQEELRRIGGKSQAAPDSEGEEAAAERGHSTRHGREQARGMVELGNAAITAGDFAEAAAQFEGAHELLVQVDGPRSAAAHKTRALATAMARKAAQAPLPNAAAPASVPAPKSSANKASDRSAPSPSGHRRHALAGSDSQGAAYPPSQPPPPQQHQHQHQLSMRRSAQPSAAPWQQGQGGSSSKASDDDGNDAFMRTSHSLDSVPPAPPDARATDEPAREGEDEERAAARCVP
jgi:hypothetical protein